MCVIQEWEKERKSYCVVMKVPSSTLGVERRFGNVSLIVWWAFLFLRAMSLSAMQ